MNDPLPNGFSFSGVHCGIKPAKADLALIVAEFPAVAAGVYTQNLVRATSIDWNRSITPTSGVRAVVANSGNANACTGQQGIADNRAMAQAVAQQLTASSSTVSEREILVLSTGVIGRPMPMPKVLSGIPLAKSKLGNGINDFHNAAGAIMTTDHTRKTAHRKFESDGSSWSIAAMAKGAGMIGPSMATMLSVIVTDFPLTPETADSSLRSAVHQSFNRISVEGHTSTNDACILLAKPMATNAKNDSEKSLFIFRTALNELTLELARKIPADGEGASHLIRIVVTGAATDADADRVARTIAMSNLVKTAVAGADPNWGRIVSAAGYAGVQLDVNDVSLRVNGLQLFTNGEPTPFDAAVASQSIRNSFDTLVELTIGQGGGCSEHYTSDLTADYVRLNADYTT